MSLGANAHTRNELSSAWGQEWWFNAAATNNMDLGAGNIFFASDTQPCAILWTEHPIGGATALQVFAFLNSTGGTFEIDRGSATTISVSTFGIMDIFFRDSTTRNIHAVLGAPKLTDHVSSVFLLRCAKGVNSATPGDFTLFWGGASIGQSAFSASTTGSLAVAANSFGGIPTNPVSGVHGNLRIWDRAPNDEECRALISDPYLGAHRSIESLAGLVSSTSFFAPWTQAVATTPI